MKRWEIGLPLDLFMLLAPLTLIVEYIETWTGIHVHPLNPFTGRSAISSSSGLSELRPLLRLYHHHEKPQT